MPALSISWSSAKLRERPSEIAASPGACGARSRRAVSAPRTITASCARAARGLPAFVDAALQILRGQAAPGERLCDTLTDFLPVHAVRDDAARARQLARPVDNALGVAPQGTRDHVGRRAKRRLSPHVD